MKKKNAPVAGDNGVPADVAEKTKGISLIDENLLKSKVYTIRGVKVMLDADLAEIYGYSTKDFNRQVKNNIERFPEIFRFQLTTVELENLKSQNVISSWGGAMRCYSALPMISGFNRNSRIPM